MKIALLVLLLSSLTLSAWLYHQESKSEAREQTYKQLLLKNLKAEAHVWQEMFESSSRSEHELMRDLILINLEGVVNRADLLAKLDGMESVTEFETIQKARETVAANPIKSKNPTASDPNELPRKVLIPGVE